MEHHSQNSATLMVVEKEQGEYHPPSPTVLLVLSTIYSSRKFGLSSRFLEIEAYFNVALRMARQFIWQLGALGDVILQVVC